METGKEIAARGEGEKKLLSWRQEKRNCFSEAGKENAARRQEKKLLRGGRRKEGRRKDIVDRNRNRGKKIVENNRIRPEMVIAAEGAGDCGHKEFRREPINLLNVNTLCWVACR